jgi:methionyl-tRNA synthetase
MLNIDIGNWDQAGHLDLVQPGHAIGEVALLFEKLEDEVIDQQIEKLKKAQTT